MITRYNEFQIASGLAQAQIQYDLGTMAGEISEETSFDDFLEDRFWTMVDDIHDRNK